MPSIPAHDGRGLLAGGVAHVLHGPAGGARRHLALPATRCSACPAGGCSSSHLHYTRGSAPPPSLTAGDPWLPYSYSLLQRNTLREYWRCLLSPAGCHPRWLAPCPCRPHHYTHGARQASQASDGGRRGGGKWVVGSRVACVGGRRQEAEGGRLRVNPNTSRPRHAAAPTQGHHPLVGSERPGPPRHWRGKGDATVGRGSGDGRGGEGEREVSGQG